MFDGIGGFIFDGRLESSYDMPKSKGNHMKSLVSLCISILTLSFFSATAAPLGVNIIQNGDFEILGDHDFPPWQFENGFNAFVNEWWKVASGGNCVFVAGQMWQDLSTEVGQAYRVSYFERGDDMAQSYRASLLNVFWDGQLIGSHTEYNWSAGWNYNEFIVVALSPSTRLMFQQASGTIGSYGYPGVDLVSVITVPEPSTLGMAAITFGMLLYHRCRARKRRFESAPES